MKNLLCWESEDIKNLKLNSRKVDENDQISLETRKLLEKLMEPDFRVYNHFRKKFFEEVENLGDIEMREELADLDRVNTEITEKCDFKAADNSKLRNALIEKFKKCLNFRNSHKKTGGKTRILFFFTFLPKAKGAPKQYFYRCIS